MSIMMFGRALNTLLLTVHDYIIFHIMFKADFTNVLPVVLNETKYSRVG